MYSINFYFSSLLSFLIGTDVLLCTKTKTTSAAAAAQWKDSCAELAQNMQQLVVELDQQIGNAKGQPAQMPPSPSSPSQPLSCQPKKMIEKIKQLKNFADQLAAIVQREGRTLLQPLIVEHALKIGHFCQHLLSSAAAGEQIGAAGGELIMNRLRDGIDQTKGRISQMRRMLGTAFVEWDIWPMLYNFKPGAGLPTFNAFVEEMVQHIGKMVKQIRPNDASSSSPLSSLVPLSYYQTASFEQALTKLTALTQQDEQGQDGDEYKKVGKIWTNVQQLMISASKEMLANLTADLVGPSSTFYGINLLRVFARQIHFADKICADAKAMFEQRKPSINEQIRSIAAMLHCEMNNALQSNAAGLEKGAIKRRDLIELLKKGKNVFGKVLNRLDMADVSSPTEMIKDKLKMLEHMLKQYSVEEADRLNNDRRQNGDEVVLSDPLHLNCLNTDGLEQAIAEEADKFSNLNIF